MEKKSIYYSCFSIIIAVMLFAFGLGIAFSNKENIIASTGNVTEYNSLSNKKVAWGIKRANNHEQPDVGKENRSLMDKYNGLYMGNPDKKYVYLTFDAGYEAGYTEKILEVLKQNDVTATFFITGHYLNTQPDLVKKMIEGGNIVGNHTPRYLMSGVVAKKIIGKFRC